MDGDENLRSKPTRHSDGRPNNILLWVVLLIVVGAGCFYGGVAYEKGHRSNVATNGSSTSRYGGGFGSGSGRFGGGNRVFGQVTAISSSSITVQNTRTGTSTTLAITSSTKITDNGQTATTSSIQTGTEVFVSENTSDTSQAASIMVNPSFDGGQGQQSGNSSTSATSD